MTNSLMIEGTVKDINTDLFGVSGFTLLTELRKAEYNFLITCSDYARHRCKDNLKPDIHVMIIGSVTDKGIYADNVYFQHWGEDEGK